MSQRLPTNPFARSYQEREPDEQDGPIATMALAYELRTANLIAYAQFCGPAVSPELRGEIYDRLGIDSIGATE